jgi:hypothetical protein
MGGNVPYTCRAVRLRFEIVSNRAAFGGAHTDTRRRCRLFRRPHRRRNRLGAALGTIWLAGLNAGFHVRFPGQLIKRRSGDRTAPTMKSTLRGLMFVASSAGLAWACLSTPGIALADDTPNPCDALKRIVAAAPNGFTSLQSDDGKAVALPYGQDAQCAVKAGTYSCSWTKGPNAGSAADALQGVAADIASCLPDATHDQNSPGRQHFYIGARGQRTQITATTAGAGKLTLAVSGK